MAVIAAVVLLALRPKFIRCQLARLLKRLKAVRIGMVSVEFERKPDPTTESETAE